MDVADNTSNASNAFWSVFPLAFIATGSGPILSAGIFTYMASTATDVTVAAIGLIGTLVSSGTTMFLAVRTARKMNENGRRLHVVERKVSSPRTISASAGEGGAVVVNPPTEAQEDE